ncbi:hypothetical protein BO70DRAFT_364625 [Aspergillus heteromorphus CBS 117.55]|uniref:Uncharacterized protein n=1 Tax=Aspergillus heteromorphus CBS 117.55 TaxID=1448321 RepID=A0A317VPD3_9EURO|nr:uncharacterized protein BO70DRAFT_364625 [Aspergillus heteromorphus CBS 117.55]PWY73710.1 hypothetical protein BO70DRAFT_364625 [Aspergillus heteromorphus CBS 117.55]
MAHPDESAPSYIPEVAKPLAPYIKSRQEILRIRQALTVYLRSQIEFADDDPDHPGCYSQSRLSLMVPHDAVVDVKRIPPELTGLRRKYLEALQANVAARREYQSVVEKTSPVNQQTDKEKEKPEQPAPDPSSALQEYLGLLRDRRRHAKLQVFEHYLKEIKQRDTVKPEDLEETGAGYRQLTPPGDLGDSQHESKTRDNIEELMDKLERAVIRAKGQLEREKGLLEELKAQRASDPPGEIPPAVKLKALQRTRDELVQWVEEKLMAVGNSETSTGAHDLRPEDLEESARLLEDKKAQIAEQYAAYVDARKRLLDAASRACQPIAPVPTKPPTRPSSMVQEKKAPGDVSSLDPLRVLSFTSDVLQPLSKSQRALALQRSYLSGMLAKEKASTLRILNRLSDESHLLPEYPILARQPRFKHAAAALASRQGTNPEPAKPDEILAMAEAWAFASDAAGANEQEYVEHKLEEGMEMAQEAGQVLQGVYNLLNQDLEDALREGAEGGAGESDIWLSEARMTRSQAKSHRSQSAAKGPWVGLNGQVGVEE